LVFGARSGQAMMKDAPVKKRHAAGLPGSPAPAPKSDNPGNPGNSANAHASKPAAAKSGASPALSKIKDVMWRQVGILRDGKDLVAAIDQLRALELPKSEKPGRADHELRNMHTLALLMAQSALARQESRGSHYRADFPYRDDEEFAKHSLVQRGKEVKFEG
jgi:succinate dehydrogenase/fumarate reductase flavoprotein subunit